MLFWNKLGLVQQRLTHEENVEAKPFEQSDIALQVAKTVVHERIATILAVEAVHDSLDEELSEAYFCQNTHTHTERASALLGIYTGRICGLLESHPSKSTCPWPGLARRWWHP